MPAVNLTAQQDAYEIVVTCSPVYECALGVAAYTWPAMVDKLERTPEQWQAMIATASSQTREEVDLAGKVHTWRSLLFLAHRCPDLSTISLTDHVSYFSEWMSTLGTAISALAAPYLGERNKERLEAALAGDGKARTELLRDFREDPLVLPNLQYLLAASPEQIGLHFRRLLLGWYEAMPHREAVLGSLESDREAVQQLVSTMSPAELVRRATNGTELQPEPMIRRIWLAPQISYRPFTIFNRMPETGIYYYPVADERMPGQREHQSALQVANLHKAVGDVHRVRILQLLHRSPRSVTELGQLLDLAKSTAHHHLLLLRSAGLVRMENGVYTLEAKNVGRLGPRLAEYVGLEGGWS